MNNIYEFRSEHIGLWAILFSKLILVWILLFIVLTYFLPIFIYFPSAKYLIMSLVTAYLFWKHNPQEWNNLIKIDFDEKLIKKNDMTISFDSLQYINASQYEHFIFPTYYKISCQDNNNKIVKLAALKSPNKYSEILREFNKTGISIN